MQSECLYQIRLRGHLDSQRSEWFDGLALVREANGETTLTGPVRDQAALHGLLNRVRDLNLTLIAVTRLEAGEAGG
jgi:hypothetical protein